MGKINRIAVVGCGALGSYYGAKLWKVGHDVVFLLRSDYQVVRSNGVLIESSEESFVAHPKPAKDPHEVGIADLILVALKTTANHRFRELIMPLVGPNSVVLTLQNGLGSDDELARIFGPNRVMSGHCFVCLNRIAPGVIKHLAHGRIVIGEYSGPPTTRTWEIAEIFRSASIQCDVVENVQRAHWEKLMWNVPFNGLGVAGIVGYEGFMSKTLDFAPEVVLHPVLTTEDLLKHAGWREVIKGLMEELRTTAAAYDIQISEGFIDLMFELTSVMGPYKASTLLDFEKGLPMELDAIFLEPLRRAATLQVSTPLLQRLCDVLVALDGLRERIYQK